MHVAIQMGIILKYVFALDNPFIVEVSTDNNADHRVSLLEPQAISKDLVGILAISVYFLCCNPTGEIKYYTFPLSMNA